MDLDLDLDPDSAQNLDLEDRTHGREYQQHVAMLSRDWAVRFLGGCDMHVRSVWATCMRLSVSPLLPP